MQNDARRRATLQPVGESHGNIRSGIPLPSTAKKPTPNPRMSLSGPAIRINPYPAPPGTNPRNSTMFRSQNSNPLLMSASKGKTPLTNARRGSMWAGGAGVASMPSSSQPQKDSRPIRDRSFQNKERSDILNYLQSVGMEISMNSLINIQSKHYRAIFESLVHLAAPGYPLDPLVKFEEIFIPALQALRYPYAHSMDNKWLAAVGSPHSWPHLLGVLHWLVELCKMKEHYCSSSDPTLQDPDNVTEEFQDPLDHRALAFDYYEKAYIIWLNHEDEFVDPNQRLEDRFAKKNERVQNDLEAKIKQLNEAEIENKNLKTADPPIKALQEKNNLYTRDLAKYEDVLPKNEAKKNKLLHWIDTMKDDLIKNGETLERMRAEQEELNNTVKEQNMTQEEVSRMTTDYDMLWRNVEDLKQKISETERTVMSFEVTLANRISATEETLHTYTVTLSDLGLLPPLPPPHQDIDLTLELNTASSDLQQLLTGADIKRVIKPTVSNVAESKRSLRAEVENERIRVDNDIEQLTLDCDTLDDEINQLEKKVAAVNEQAVDLHNAAQQDALLAGERARQLETMLANARTAAIANGMGVKSRLQQLQFDYREQVERVNRLKDETVRAVIKNSSDIAQFKVEVASRLRELRECAEIS
ncbi:hypothetical protein BT96DRAFT_954872 [Gymnopus androsaceus JB14]|uniref:Kinetochore protein NDC80 n=1 Tax=Gymnopus androsaceus JB14 TaxID=1447944 RepID=A0A6A4IAT4_9AGAR|nr:hypothetical protein BT96DRAFT_954872 [Gymnopus androsaceus JB14]